MNFGSLFISTLISFVGATVKLVNIGSNPANTEVHKELHLTWRISDMYRDQCLHTFDLFFNSTLTQSNKILTAGSNGKKQETIHFERVQKSEVLFTEKVTGKCNIDIPDAVCSFRIKDPDYTVNGLVLLHYICIHQDVDRAIGKITVNTRGGPDACGEHTLTQNITCIPGENIFQRVTLCGKPEPKLTWKVGGRVINGTIDRSMANIHQYTYQIIFPAYGNCGKRFVYVAIGHKGFNKTEESRILPQALNYRGDADGLETFATVGIVLASLFLISLVCVVICCKCRRNNKGTDNTDDKDISVWSEDATMASAPLASEHA